MTCAPGREPPTLPGQGAKPLIDAASGSVSSRRISPFQSLPGRAIRYDEFLPALWSVTDMTGAVKKTISLPPDLARAAEQIARAEGKTLSAVLQDALRDARAARLREELETLQGYWSQRAKEQGILTEEDLQRYLRA